MVCIKHKAVDLCVLPNFHGSAKLTPSIGLTKPLYVDFTWTYVFTAGLLTKTRTNLNKLNANWDKMKNTKT